MAYQIVWSLQARDDLRDIVLFIAADNPSAAQAFGLRLINKADSLANFPELGRIVPEQDDRNIREIILRPYRVIYQVLPIGKVIAIVRIWHGARGEPDIPLNLTF